MLIASTAHGQPAAPDAGSVLQQIEGGQRPPVPTLQRPPAVPGAPPPAPEGTTVQLSAIRFEGNTVLDSGALSDLVAPWLARPLRLGELQQIARSVAEAYRQAGYLARTAFEPQDLTGGIATLHITEARFGALRIEAAQPVRVPTDRLRRTVDDLQATGDLLHIPALDRAMLLTDDLPGVAVRGQFTAGTEEGQTDLVLTAEPEALVRGRVSADNAGSRSIGAQRVGADLELASPMSRGDLASLALLHSQGSDYLRAAYAVPLGYAGAQIGVAASSLRYRLVSPELETLGASGRSRHVEVQASYPLRRSQTANLYAGLRVTDKHYVNQASGNTSSDYGVRSASLSVWGNRLDGWWGGGFSTASLAFAPGRLDLGGSPSEAADSAGPRAAGSFRTWRWQASREQTLTPRTSLNLHYSGQWASKNLDSSEKMYLGGVNGVRAYPSGEAGGSSGQLVNLDLQFGLNGWARLAAFVDWGEVTAQRYAFAGGPNRTRLAGSGLSLELIGPRGLQARLTWARRLGHHPNPLANGRDQDGSLHRNRLWASVSLAL